MRKVSIVARKLVRVTLTLGVILCLLWIGIVPAQNACGGACCVRSGMQGCQHPTGVKDTSQPRGCCSGSEACPCEVAQDCPSKLPDSSVFAVPRTGNPSQADITDSAIDVFPPLHFQSGFRNKIWRFGAGPPLAIYLLKLSLLC